MKGDMVFLVLFFAIVFIGTGIRRYYSYKIDKNRQRRSLKERILEMLHAEGSIFAVLYFASSIYVIVLLPLYLLFPSFFLLFQMPFPDWLRWVGVGLGFLSVPFLLWVHYVLDEEWSITLKFQADHKLVTGGPYRRIRHPMYAALIAYELSWVLVSASLLFLVYYAITVLLMIVRIPKEEQMMLDKFGEEYRSYMKRTGRCCLLFDKKAVKRNR